MKENRGLAGIYLWVKQDNFEDCYIGQAINLRNRLRVYFSNAYLKQNKTSIICNSLLKNGHKNFNLIVLEYCQPTKDKLNEREQVYLDGLNCRYNILRIASSPKGHKYTEKALGEALKRSWRQTVVYRLNSNINELKWVNTFNSIREASSALGFPEKSTQKYRDTSFLYRGEYLFSCKPLENEALKLILAKIIKNKIKNKFVFLYHILPDKKINYIWSYNSIVLAAKEFNISKRTIYAYLRRGILIRENKNTWIMSDSPNLSALPSIDKAHKVSINKNSPSLIKRREGNKVIFSKYLSGNTVFVYTQRCAEKEKIEFLGEYISQQSAAIAVGCSAVTVARCLQSRKIHITKDKQKKIYFSYSFLPPPSALQTRNS